MAPDRALDPDAARFERAVEAVIDGDAATLSSLLQEDPALVHARSRRVTSGDPPVHGATLLHYLAANGVEDERQRSPANAPEIATTLLLAGADPNALCRAYGSRCTTLSLLVSSTPPAKAGVQIPVMHVLIDHGAAVAPTGEGDWTSPLLTALVFGFTDTAKALVARGAAVDRLASAAGLGRIEDVQRMLLAADADDRHRALALAAQLGHAEIVRLLIDAGEDPSQFNPPGTHAHSTPLHQAACAGHLDVVAVLIEKGARRDIEDKIHRATPLGWAQYCRQPAIVEYLVNLGRSS
jgi:ankyrin repeat protein